VRTHWDTGVFACVAKGSDDLTLNYISASNEDGVTMTIDRCYDLTIGKNMLDDDNISVTCRYARVYDGSMSSDTNGVAPIIITNRRAKIYTRMPLIWWKAITIEGIVPKTHQRIRPIVTNEASHGALKGRRGQRHSYLH